MDRKYVLTAFGYLLLGLLLGIHMAASKVHTQFVTHAHIMLVGFVLSFIYALCHKLWIKPEAKLLALQYYTHQIGTVVLLIGLFLLYGQFVSEQLLGPIMGIASFVVLVSAILMKVILIKSFKQP